MIVEGQKLHVSLAFRNQEYQIDARAPESLNMHSIQKDPDYKWVQSWNQEHSIPFEVDVFDITRVKESLELLKDAFSTAGPWVEGFSPSDTLNYITLMAQSSGFAFFLMITKHS